MYPDIWYDRSLRLWVLLWKDPEGNQVGDADYYTTKPAAIAASKTMYLFTK